MKKIKKLAKCICMDCPNVVFDQGGKIKKRRGVTGLGWANRALSRKQDKPALSLKRVRPSIHAAVVLADDLMDAIQFANFQYCSWGGQTTHMKEAIANYLRWKEENNV